MFCCQNTVKIANFAKNLQHINLRIGALSSKSFQNEFHSGSLQNVAKYHKITHVLGSFATPRRSYSSDINNKRPQRSLPTLMDFPEIIWPSIINTMKNWILVHFIIRPYFDTDFNLPDFIKGTKQALQIVSSSLSGGEIKNLTGLIKVDALNELKTSVARLSMTQRSELHVIKEDIYFSFPYQIGVMFDESDETVQKRFVEITMVFHVLRGLKGMMERGEPVPMNIGVTPEFRDKISICNYRFIKEFTQGVESDWTINIVNHFKPSDYIDQDP